MQLRFYDVKYRNRRSISFAYVEEVEEQKRLRESKTF